MGIGQIQIRHCILYEYKKAHNHRKQQKTFVLPMKMRPRVFVPANDGLNNLNRAIVSSLTPLDQEAPLLLICVKQGFTNQGSGPKCSQNCQYVRSQTGHGVSEVAETLSGKVCTKHQSKIL